MSATAIASGLDRWLDPHGATTSLVAAGLEIVMAEPEYLRHKPGETTIVSYRFGLPDGSLGRGYVHWCERPARADEIFAKALTLRPQASTVGGRTMRVDDRTVFYGFPNDARLRRLRWYSSERKLRHSLATVVGPSRSLVPGASTASILRYKPERRMVARVDLGFDDGSQRTLLVRCTASAGAGQLAQVARALRRHGIDTPAPLAQLDGHHVSVDEFVAGRSLRDAAHGGAVDPGALAAAIAALHDTPPPPGLAQRTPERELDAARASLRSLVEREPAMAGLASHLASALATAMPAARPAVLVHGDLHDENVLIDGSTVRFIDLERVALGSPAIDLGILLARALAADAPSEATGSEVRALVACTIDELGDHVDRDELGWHTAVALIDQCLLLIRHLRLDAPAEAQLLLELALSHADRPGRPAARARQQPLPTWAGRWAQAHPRPAGEWTLRDGARWGVLDPAAGLDRPVDPAADSSLPGLAPALATGTLIGYRAGRRAVVAGPSCFTKVVRPRRAGRLVATHEALAGLLEDVELPRVLAAHADGRVDLSIVPGWSLHDLRRRGGAEPVVAVARALAALHSVPTTSVALLGLTARPPDDAATWIAIVDRSGLGVDILPALERAAERLPPVAPAARSLVHGDLHDKNVLVDGGRIGLIDLDGLGLGAPEDDVVNLAVHLELRDLQARRHRAVVGTSARRLLAAYGQLAPLDPDRVVAIERRTWLRLACLYRLRRTSAHLAPVLIERALGPDRSE